MEGPTSRQLQRDVAKVVAAVDAAAPAEHIGRRAELLTAVLQDPTFAEHSQHDAAVAIATGVGCRLQEMRDSGLHLTSNGRLIYNGIKGAAVCRLDDRDAARSAGFLDRAAALMQQDVSTLYRDCQVEKNRDSIVEDDPTRKKRSDAFTVEHQRRVFNAWLAVTRPEPTQ